MVIQHNIPALNSHRYLGINNSKTSKNLEKLSSGFRINRAADDAAGLAISEKMRGQISGLGMAEQNANNGISLIQTAEGGLNETHSILQRMRELAVQSSNGTYQDEDRAQIELEYQALKSEMDRIASYTNYNGIKLLDGTIGGARLELARAPGTPITGTDAQIKAALGVTGTPTHAAVSSAGGFQVTTGDTPAAAGDFTAPAVTINALDAGTLDSKVITFSFDGTNWSSDVNTVLNGTYNVATTVKADLTAFMGTLSTTAFAGGTSFEVKLAGVASTASIQNVSGTKKGAPADVDAWKGSVSLISKDDGTFDVELGADFMLGKGTTFVDPSKTLVSATHDGTDIVLDFGGGKTVKIAMAADATAKANTTGLAANDPTNTTLMAGATYRITSTGTAATGVGSGYNNDPTLKPLTPDQSRILKMLDGMGLKVESEFDLNMSGIDAYYKNAAASGLDTNLNLFDELNNQDAYIITRASVNDTTERNVFDADQGYETILQVGDKTFLGRQNGTDIEFVITNPEGADWVIGRVTNAEMAQESGAIRFNTGDLGKFDGTVTAAGAKTYSENTNRYYKSALTDKEDAIIGAEYTAQLVFQVGANGAEDQRIGMYVFNMSSNNLGDHVKGNFVSESTILTRDEANIAVDTIDSALNYVSAQRAQLGALQNRLEHTLNNLGVTKENLTAAESSIRDVDMAKEMMDFTKNNILVQAAQAMLAQANQLPQGVLQLLR